MKTDATIMAARRTYAPATRAGNGTENTGSKVVPYRWSRYIAIIIVPTRVSVAMFALLDPKR